MRANVGDHIVIRGHHVGEPGQDGEVREVRGRDGEPPYVVRWSGSDHDSLVFPGSDASIQHVEPGTPGE